MTNGLMERALMHRKPGEKELYDICKIPDRGILSLWDFVATFCIILVGFLSSSILLLLEYIFKISMNAFLRIKH